MSKTLETSPNALINKQLLDRYSKLEIPENKVIATYVWFDEVIRSKERVLNFEHSAPKSVTGKLRKIKKKKHSKLKKCPFFVCRNSKLDCR